MMFAAGWLAPKSMVQAAIATDECLMQARTLGLSEEVAREEIRNEQARASRRLRAFDWSEVRRQITWRAKAAHHPKDACTCEFGWQPDCPQHGKAAHGEAQPKDGE